MNPTILNNLPKVGIRPTIDGRLGGVRESLEDQCRGMAQRVANLISEQLRYPNGTPVECVIADSNIGGVVEASACEEKFRRENVGLTLTVTPCWCYGSETMDMDPHRPKAVLGFNGTERPGAVYLAAALAGHAQKGLPAFGIYGRDVQDAGDTSIPEDVQEKVLAFVRAGLAVAIMRGKSYLSMGGTSMGIAGSMLNYDLWEKSLGMRVEDIDMSEFAGRMKQGLYDQEEYERALKWVRQHCQEGRDFNSEDQRRSREQLDRRTAQRLMETKAPVERGDRIKLSLLFDSEWDSGLSDAGILASQAIYQPQNPAAQQGGGEKLNVNIVDKYASRTEQRQMLDA